MARTLASCRIALGDVVPTLRDAGLLSGDGVRATLPASTLLTLRTDSRKLQPGDCFLAYQGVSSDGHDHLDKAVQLGAGLLVVENQSRLPKDLSVPWVAVTNGRAAWAHLAARAFGNPERQLTMLGVTGTNGKSSTAWITGHMLKSMGVPAMVVGTLGAHLLGAAAGDEVIPTTHTTPDPDVLYGLFALALDQGVRVVAMEVSSHAVAQAKVAPIRFDGCAFTSFTRDHLDLHGTMEDYWAAKWQLFSVLAKPTARLIFNDGLMPAPPLGELRGETVVYGLNANATKRSWQAQHALTIVVEQDSSRGSSIALDYDGQRTRGEIPYFAKHAVENFAAALLLAEKAAGTMPSPAHWPGLAPVRGRLEQVTSSPSNAALASGPGGPNVLVDYAHTPDALEKTLQVLRPLAQGKLAVVFGCGGDRDRGKRPQMGAIAARLADRVYLTSDNPRSEDPLTIIAEIQRGVDQVEHRGIVVVEADRARAIGRAIAEAGGTDLVVIAGKGHETYQILRDRTVPFDDRAVAAGLLGAQARRDEEG